MHTHHSVLISMMLMKCLQASRLEAERATLIKNISSLYRTAVMELDWKNKEIKELKSDLTLAKSGSAAVATSIAAGPPAPGQSPLALPPATGLSNSAMPSSRPPQHPQRGGYNTGSGQVPVNNSVLGKRSMSDGGQADRDKESSESSKRQARDSSAAGGYAVGHQPAQNQNHGQGTGSHRERSHSAGGSLGSASSGGAPSKPSQTPYFSDEPPPARRRGSSGGGSSDSRPSSTGHAPEHRSSGRYSDHDRDNRNQGASSRQSDGRAREQDGRQVQDSRWQQNQQQRPSDGSRGGGNNKHSQQQYRDRR